MRFTSAVLGLLVSSAALAADEVPSEGPNHVEAVKTDDGWRLRIDGQDTLLYGMNWGYVPIGTNYGYDFWRQPEELIVRVLRREMAQLQAMGVNSIRQYDNIPPRWVTWIYDNYGITTMVNPLVGRYGVTIDGAFIPVVDYSDPKVREVLTTQTLESVKRYRNTRGVVMFLLGNEANYGLEWSSFEIEALPQGDQQATKARYLYSLYGEIIDAIHAIDDDHPVAICNGDLQYLDIIAEEAGQMDLFGTNVYRGRTARDAYARVDQVLDRPIFYAEFGADAFDAAAGTEDHLTQASYLRDQWEDVYIHAAKSNGGVGNAIGGYIFQWSDGWWKYKQEENLDVHDTNASWPNRAYIEDYVEGKNNMNEEWFGITGKVPPDPSGYYEVQPRSAYYLLSDAFKLDPYAPSTTPEVIEAHFDALRPGDYEPQVAALKALALSMQDRVKLTMARIDLSMHGVAGTNQQGNGPLNASVDHTQSIYLGGSVTPVDNLTAEASINVLGNVAANPIDNIFYENRGARATDPSGLEATQLDRVQVYQASVDWSEETFDLDGFYRTGHFHWSHEGDLFHLYPEANYGPFLDLYNGVAPIGVEITGKKAFEGLAVAVGPQLWWGANPAVVARAGRQFGDHRITLTHHEDLTTASVQNTSVAISEQVIRRTGLAYEYERGNWKVEAGGLWSGSNKVGQSFRYVKPAAGGTSFQDSGYDVVDDVIRIQDTFGGKARIIYEGLPVRFYAGASYAGLVADAGWDPRVTLTGWQLKLPGRGNHTAGIAGAVFSAGDFQISPNVLAQRPLVGPNPSIGDSYDPDNGWYTPRVAARNFRDDPFAVLENRETYAGELLLVYDPTPGTWFWSWDNDDREDAPFAASLDFVYRIQPTVRDARFGFTGDGVLFAFDGSPPASDEWTVTSKLVFNTAAGTKAIVNAYVGQQQSNGIDDRLLFRGGADFRLWYRALLVRSFLRINDWGPYDFHRDFNLTFPVQTMLDISGGIGKARTFLPNTRFGVQGKFRVRDANSPDFDALIEGEMGWEAEINTYLTVML